jgi:hypothetical protein
MPLRWMSTAERAGVTLHDLHELIEGRVTMNVANRIGVRIADIDAFIEGRGTAYMEQRLKLQNMSAVEDLAQSLGREGAIGFVVALLLAG